MQQQRVKMVDAPAGRVGGYLLVWGVSPHKGGGSAAGAQAIRRDMQGEYFTPQTDVGLDWYEQRPVLYHHGLDGNLKAAVIGVIDTLTPDETGLWAEAQLDLRKRYVRAVQRLVDQGVLSWVFRQPAASGRRGRRRPHQALAHRRRQPDTHARRATAFLCANPQERLQVAGFGHVPAGLGSGGRNKQRNDKIERTVNERRNDQERSSACHWRTSARRLKLNRVAVGSEYDSLDALDMLHGYMLLRSGQELPRRQRALFQRAGGQGQPRPAQGDQSR